MHPDIITPVFFEHGCHLPQRPPDKVVRLLDDKRSGQMVARFSSGVDDNEVHAVHSCRLLASQPITSVASRPIMFPFSAYIPIKRS